MKTNDILNSNNLIADLKKKLEACEAKVTTHQSAIDKARLHLREQTKELGQVLFSVKNLYNRCNNARQHDPRGLQHGRKEEGDNARQTGDHDGPQAVASYFESGGAQTSAELDAISTHIQGFIDIVASAKGNPEAYEGTGERHLTGMHACMCVCGTVSYRVRVADVAYVLVH